MGNQFFQHGDVILIPIPDSEIPTDAVPSAEPGVIMEGELTGHAHRVPVIAGTMVLLAGAQKFLRAPKGTRPAHEEHKAYELPPGSYRVERVVENDPFEDMVRPVAD